jgi:hypothetical protein
MLAHDDKVNDGLVDTVVSNDTRMGRSAHWAVPNSNGQTCSTKLHLWLKAGTVRAVPWMVEAPLEGN